MQLHAMEAGKSSGGMGHFVLSAQVSTSPIKPKWILSITYFLLH